MQLKRAKNLHLSELSWASLKSVHLSPFNKCAEDLLLACGQFSRRHTVTLLKITLQWLSLLTILMVSSLSLFSN